MARPTGSSLDTLRLSSREKDRLVTLVDQHGAQSVPHERRALRATARQLQATLTLHRPHQEPVHFQLTPRNLARRGLAFIHGQFIHPGTPVQITLQNLHGQSVPLTGHIARCRHLQGIVHELSVVFDQSIDLTAFLWLNPQEQARHTQERENERPAPTDTPAAVIAPMRVLVMVQENSERQRISRWLNHLQCDSVEVIGQANLQRLFDQAEGPACQVLLMDLDHPQVAHSQLERIRASGWNGTILGLGDARDPVWQTMARQWGIQQLLSRPLTLQGLKTALQPLRAPAAPTVHGVAEQVAGLLNLVQSATST